MIDPDNPCTMDCPDRPNCKGCIRGNAYRKKKIEESKEKYEKNSFHRYELDMKSKAFDISAKRRKKKAFFIHRD